MEDLYTSISVNIAIPDLEIKDSISQKFFGQGLRCLEISRKVVVIVELLKLIRKRQEKDKSKMLNRIIANRLVIKDKVLKN